MDYFHLNISVEGGLEELEEEFDASKILFAFAKVKDNDVEKMVFVSWCGEGVPVGKKALLNIHLAPVRNLFKVPF